MEKTFKEVTNIVSDDETGKWYLCNIGGKRWKVNVKDTGNLGESLKNAIDNGAEVGEYSPNYTELRQKEYPALGDQLDAIWKQLNTDRLNGKDLISEADSLLGAVLAVKAKYPKGE